MTAAEKTRVSATKLGRFVDTGTGGLTTFPPTSFTNWDDVLLTSNEKSRIQVTDKLVGTDGTSAPASAVSWNAGENVPLSAAEQTRIQTLQSWIPSTEPSFSVTSWDDVLLTSDEKTRVARNVGGRLVDGAVARSEFLTTSIKSYGPYRTYGGTMTSAAASAASWAPSAGDTFGVVAMVVPNWGIAFGNPYEGQSVGDNELGDADCISGVAGDIGVCSAA